MLRIARRISSRSSVTSAYEIRVRTFEVNSTSLVAAAAVAAVAGNDEDGEH